MSRPKLLTIGKTLYWAIRVFNASGVLIDADASPTVVVRKNGSVTGDSVTVTKRSATTGIYDCAYNPASEIEGDSFEIEETVTISAVAYANDAWVCQVIAVERGTDLVDVSGIDATASDISQRIPSDLENSFMLSSVAELSTAALEQIAAAISGAGYGPRTVTITVNYSGLGVVGAVVRLVRGTASRLGITATGGVITFNVTDGDWVVSIAAEGYTFAGATLTVDGSETAAYTLSLLSVSTSTPPMVTGYWTVYAADGTAAEGVAVVVRAVRPQRGSAGVLHLNADRSADSDAEGLVEFPNLLPGWVYRVTIDSVVSAEVAIAADATGTVSLGSCVLPSA